MTYYYNGIKVRTSNNKYTHAVIYGNKVIACCSSEDLAIKRSRSEVIYQTKRYMDNKEYYEQHQNEKTDYVINWLKNQFEKLQTIRVIELEIK